MDGGDNVRRRKRSRTGPRYQIEVTFPDEEKKRQFVARLDRVKARISASSGTRSVDNLGLLWSLLDHYERSVVPQGSGAPSSSQKKSILKNSGVHSGSNEFEDGEKLFVCERDTLSKLMVALEEPCSCKSICRSIKSMSQHGHVLRCELQCRSCHTVEWWASSRVFGGKFMINQRLVHGFTCAGILPSQYINFSTFSDIGIVHKRYIYSISKSMKYIEVVSKCVEVSFSEAIEECTALPDYATLGEWVITDARHDSTVNAYHTTVPCLSGRTHKIVGCCTLSRKEHITAQTRELACTKVVLPEVIEKGLFVTEVAHDNSPSVKNYIVKDLNLVNSYDTWHGTKNVAKQMKAIAVGPVKKSGVTWFPELSDKRKSTKVHLYYCMKNCGNDPNKLRSSILNIVNHYRGYHSHCHTDSNCQKKGYASSKVTKMPLTYMKRS